MKFKRLALCLIAAFATFASTFSAVKHNKIICANAYTAEDFELYGYKKFELTVDKPTSKKQIEANFPFTYAFEEGENFCFQEIFDYDEGNDDDTTLTINYYSTFEEYLNYNDPEAVEGENLMTLRRMDHKFNSGVSFPFSSGDPQDIISSSSPSYCLLDLNLCEYCYKKYWTEEEIVNFLEGHGLDFLLTARYNNYTDLFEQISQLGMTDFIQFNNNINIYFDDEFDLEEDGTYDYSYLMIFFGAQETNGYNICGTLNFETPNEGSEPYDVELFKTNSLASAISDYDEIYGFYFGYENNDEIYLLTYEDNFGSVEKTENDSIIINSSDAHSFCQPIYVSNYGEYNYDMYEQENVTPFSEDTVSTDVTGILFDMQYTDGMFEYFVVPKLNSLATTRFIAPINACKEDLWDIKYEEVNGILYPFFVKSINNTLYYLMADCSQNKLTLSTSYLDNGTIKKLDFYVNEREITKDTIETFTKIFLKSVDYSPNYSGVGNCISKGYYQEFKNMLEAEGDGFLKDYLINPEYNDYYQETIERITAWAISNGETFNPNAEDSTDYFGNKPSFINVFTNKGFQETWIIVSVCLVGLSAIGAYFFYKKNKEQ